MRSQECGSFGTRNAPVCDMSKRTRRHFGAKAIRKAINKNPYKAGIAASLLALAAAASRHPGVRNRARSLRSTVTHFFNQRASGEDVSRAELSGS